ncbi:MAG: hypothetical protein N2323_06575 [candidate division WOR-3 bacterium]|nr:hypothetical protein [candidate division WOR-3 bacterium]
MNKDKIPEEEIEGFCEIIKLLMTQLKSGKISKYGLGFSQNQEFKVIVECYYFKEGDTIGRKLISTSFSELLTNLQKLLPEGEKNENL